MRFSLVVVVTIFFMFHPAHAAGQSQLECEMKAHAGTVEKFVQPLQDEDGGSGATIKAGSTTVHYYEALGDEEFIQELSASYQGADGNPAKEEFEFSAYDDTRMYCGRSNMCTLKNNSEWDGLFCRIVKTSGDASDHK
jgi:hypothetical protein